MTSRIIFLDNLRTFLIFFVVVIHAGIVYEPILENTWIVSDPVKNNSIGFIRMYLDIFVMFSLFFLSGYFIPNSLKGKSTAGFVWSKFKRIMLPWLVAVFTLIPAYKAIFLYSRGLLQEEWYTYFHVFERLGSDPYNFANNPVQNWLWFLPVLFLFQVIYLILAKSRVLQLKLSLRTGILAALMLGVAYSMFISQQELTGWYNSDLLHFQRERLLPYFLVFLLGSLCNKLKVFESKDRNTRQYIWANVVLTVSLVIFTAVALNLFFNVIDPARDYYFISPFVDRLAYYTTLMVSMFCFLYLLLYLFRFRFNRAGRLMSELNHNSYGVYIVHMVVIGLVALMLLHISLPAFVKFLIVTLLAFLLSNVLVSAYRMTVQRFFARNVIRLAIPVAAVFLTIVVYAKQEKTTPGYSTVESVQDGMKTPEVGLHMAVIQDNLDAIRQHIALGSDLDEREPNGGSSPLITAALLGKSDAALLLIEAGADVNLQNNDGSTALHTAAFFCRTEIVKILLENGADPAIRNNAGSTALESVILPFETVKGIYDYFGQTLGPIGLVLDNDYLRKTRPVIAEILQQFQEVKK